MDDLRKRNILLLIICIIGCHGDRLRSFKDGSRDQDALDDDACMQNLGISKYMFNYL